MLPQVIDLLGVVARAEAVRHDDPNNRRGAAQFATTRHQPPRDDNADDV